MPAKAASAWGVLPTAAGFMPPPGLNTVRSSAAFSLAVTKCAPRRSISARSWAATGASTTTDCSVAQMVEESKALLLTMAVAAARTSAERST